MPPSKFHASSPLANNSAFEVAAPRSTTPVVLALAAIMVAAGVGLLRGYLSVREQAAGPAETPVAGIAGATPAIGLPHDPNWSILKGPAVLPPAPPKLQRTADNGQSDEGESEPSQAEQAATPGPDTGSPVEASPQTPPPTQSPPPQPQQPY